MNWTVSIWFLPVQEWWQVWLTSALPSNLCNLHTAYQKWYSSSIYWLKSQRSLLAHYLQTRIWHFWVDVMHVMGKWSPRDNWALIWVTTSVVREWSRYPTWPISANIYNLKESDNKCWKSTRPIWAPEKKGSFRPVTQPSHFTTSTITS